MFCFDSPVVVASSSLPGDEFVNKTNVKKSFKLKGDYIFSASSFRNVILQKVIARWSKKIFYFMKIDIEDIKSYPNEEIRYSKIGRYVSIHSRNVGNISFR